MKTIINHKNDPYFNLALEEYVFKHVESDEDILLLWVNAPSVIIGRNQVVYGEVNIPFCETQDIKVIRRISGGGTVYHDLGNLNYSVMTKNYKDVLSNYQFFTKKVIEYLQTLGIQASFSGKSDIVIKDKKISGNAQMYHHNKLLHHGTILFDTDLDKLNQVIKKKTMDIESTGIDSNRTLVTNVNKHLKESLTIEAFKDGLLTYWLGSSDINASIIHLNDMDYQKIETLKHTKYMDWSWNYGESPNFDIKKTLNDTIIHIQVIRGRIETCYLTHEQITVELSTFKGIKYEKAAFLNQIAVIESKYKALLQPLVIELFN